jgi:ketosteroid isomerase-like protein
MHAPAVTPVDVSAIKATAKPFINACLDRDWDALLDLCTDDVVFLPPEHPICSGSKEVRAYLEDYPVMERFTFEFDRIEGQDHLAAAYGHYSITVQGDEGDLEVEGKFVDTFRKDDNGKWWYACVIWNSNEPAEM